MTADASFYRFRRYRDYVRFINAYHDASDLSSKLFSIGRSAKGRDINCLRLGGYTDGKPGVLYISLVHGVEFIGGEVNLEVMKWFADPDNREKADWILSRCNVYFLPVLNPDGYAQAVWEHSNFRFTFSRKNGRGVDLNRNFSVAFSGGDNHPWTGLPLKFMPVYRGPEAFSEPETAAFRDFILSSPIRTSLSFHSSGRMIGYPYCYKKEKCADYKTLRAVAVEMRRRQKNVKYRVMQEYDYVPTSGDMDDWLYDEAGVLPFLMEIGRFGFLYEKPHRWLNPFAWVNVPRPHREIANILPGVLYLAEWAAGNASSWLPQSC